jgi:Rrf2 family transcriptional regulator, iron-sulfur cluster assembly transcription factor
MFSKACEYAIRASIYICLESKNGSKVGLKDIAKNVDSPEAFTAKILQKLVKNKVVDSLKGPTGGFFIPEEKKGRIRLSQIVKAIDGDSVYNGCGLGLRECSEINPCPLHDKFRSVRNSLRDMLESTSLKELSEDLGSGHSLLRLTDE